MKIEICIPAFNEAQVIAETANAVLHVFRASQMGVAVTVSDNASTDGTARIAQGIEGVSAMSISTRGKGAAVVAAARRSNADIFGFIDADLSASPADIISLLSLVKRGECDIAIGSRLLDTGIVNRGIFRTFSSRIFNILRRMIVGIAVEDTQCGLKLMNAKGREILAQCMETGWFFDIEFLMRAQRAGLHILEVPIHWNEHRFPGRAGKLNHFRDGIEAIRAMLRIRRSLKKDGQDG
jgi:glycosyltransferase involved in cell wall biosynthesis